MKTLAKISDSIEDVSVGWVERREHELLSETFEARHMPQLFILKNSKAYHSSSIGADHISKYI